LYRCFLTIIIFKRCIDDCCMDASVYIDALEVRMRSAHLTSSSCGGLGGLRPPELISAPLAFSAVRKKKKKIVRNFFRREDDISGGRRHFQRKTAFPAEMSSSGGPKVRWWVVGVALGPAAPGPHPPASAARPSCTRKAFSPDARTENVTYGGQPLGIFWLGFDNKYRRAYV
jgi:hypothetical protein